MLNIQNSLKISIILVLLLFLQSVNATPVFARQYSLQCVTCHTRQPALNEFGMMFLRNGFRLSKDEITALDKSSANEDRHYPVGAVVGLNYDSDDKFQTETKLFLTGSLTKTLSFYGIIKEISNNSGQNSPEFFDDKGSRYYLQYNPQGNTHVLRAGLLSPLTQLGNVKRAGALAGLNSDEAIQGSNKYKSPLQNSGVEKVRGFDYSYLRNNILFGIAYGNTINISNSNSGNHTGTGNSNGLSFGDDGELSSGNNSGSGSGNNSGSGSSGNNSDDDYNFVASVGYTTRSGYKLGLIYNRFKTKGNNQYSFILPFENNFNSFRFNSSLVYKNSSAENDYYGLENAFTIPLKSSEFIKVIVNADIDEEENNNYGYSLSYSKMFGNMFMLTLTTVGIETNYENDAII